MSEIHRIHLPSGDKRDFLEWRVSSGNTVEIYDIEVSSKRRVGRGRLLVSQLLCAIRPQTTTVFAITRIENKIAQDFYASLGFHVKGVLYEFYDSACGRVDAIIYGRKAEGAV